MLDMVFEAVFVKEPARFAVYPIKEPAAPVAVHTMLDATFPPFVRTLYATLEVALVRVFVRPREVLRAEPVIPTAESRMLSTAPLFLAFFTTPFPISPTFSPISLYCYGFSGRMDAWRAEALFASPSIFAFAWTPCDIMNSAFCCTSSRNATSFLALTSSIPAPPDPPFREISLERTSFSLSIPSIVYSIFFFWLSSIVIASLS